MFRIILIVYLLIPKPLVDGEISPEWCFYAEFDSLEAMDELKKPPKSLIKMEYNSPEVFVPCSTIE